MAVAEQDRTGRTETSGPYSTGNDKTYLNVKNQIKGDELVKPVDNLSK